MDAALGLRHRQEAPQPAAQFALVKSASGLSGLLAHIEHLIRVGGADCPALGSDHHGTIIPVAGMGDVTHLPRVTRALLERGHSPDVVRKLPGENALRVIGSVTGE